MLIKVCISMLHLFLVLPNTKKSPFPSASTTQPRIEQKIINFPVIDFRSSSRSTNENETLLFSSGNMKHERKNVEHFFLFFTFPPSRFHHRTCHWLKTTGYKKKKPRTMGAIGESDLSWVYKLVNRLRKAVWWMALFLEKARRLVKWIRNQLQVIRSFRRGKTLEGPFSNFCLLSGVIAEKLEDLSTFSSSLVAGDSLDTQK